jgi:hypothetical protein
MAPKSRKFTVGDTASKYELIGTAGSLRLWHYKGKFGHRWSVTDNKTGRELAHPITKQKGFGNYPEIHILRQAKYKLPSGTPVAWSKR